MEKVEKSTLLLQKPLWGETQGFRQTWIWILTLIPVGLILMILFAQIFLGKQIGNKPSGNAELALVLLLTLLPTLLIFFSRLETYICETGIGVRFTPFHHKYRFYPWADIEKCYVRVYNPIGEYGGWGLRGFGANRALNVSGNNGLQLELRNGQKLLIGTVLPDEITAVVVKLGKYHQ